MSYTFASATILLLLITDPLGNIPIFANALRGVAPERRARVILREVLIAFACCWCFCSSAPVSGLELSDRRCRLRRVVLFLIALRMIFPPDAGPPTDLPGEPLIVPLAIPALAGPSAMATVMLLVAQAPERKMEWVAALCVTMAVCAVVLLLAERIQRLVGERVVMAFERLMGLILVSISVEMLIRGIKHSRSSCKARVRGCTPEHSGERGDQSPPPTAGQAVTAPRQRLNWAPRHGPSAAPDDGPVWRAPLRATDSHATRLLLRQDRAA
jgi:small neutral amino acid transporter SnatA (MarC family)